MKYKERPVVVKPIQIEAVQYVKTGPPERGVAGSGSNFMEIFEFTNKYAYLMNGMLLIPTLGGDYVYHVGDWVVKEADGHFHPHECESFKRTYELIEE